MIASPSLPTQGAWIEMIIAPHIPCGCARRSLHRERGLKFAHRGELLNQASSLPTQGAWIEIKVEGMLSAFFTASLPTQGAWIEISNSLKLP